MNSESSKLQLTERELSEIKHALFYRHECGHGTVGHNMLILIAEMAAFMGFYVGINEGTPEKDAYTSLHVPTDLVEIVGGKHNG
jgi:hypothetical protein